MVSQGVSEHGDVRKRTQSVLTTNWRLPLDNLQRSGENGCMREPRPPRQVSPYARACFDALAAAGLGRCISLGGAFGLAHYHEYRPTNDVDAWWREEVDRREKELVAEALATALRPFGEVRTRSWGEVLSVELAVKGETAFSFQIAARSAQLGEPRRGLWPGEIAVDGLEDLMAAKMTALVERGAPRDFRDIHAVCAEGLCSPAQCWSLWTERQRRSRENADLQRARLAVLSHLKRLELARPLAGIADSKAREEAGRLRTWFKEELIGPALA